MNPYEISRERSARRALRKMGMCLRKSRKREIDEPYSIVWADGKAVYTDLTLNDVWRFTAEEYKVFRKHSN